MSSKDLDHILLIGFAGTGKSTFISRMSPEYMVLDFDQRWAEQKDNVLGKWHVIPNDDVVRVIEKLAELRPALRGKIGTIAVDSGTALLDTVMAFDRLKGDQTGSKKYQNEAFKRKADVMRAVSGALLQWNCNTVWTFHIEEGMLNGERRLRQTIPQTELNRLKKALNCIVEMVIDQKGRRGLKVIWSRYNNNAAAGQIILDTEMWTGVPQRLSTFIRHFKGDEGYNGRAYSLEWLQEYLVGKGKEFASVEEMTKALEIEKEPMWFDRNAWAKLIEKGGVR